jgi:hypothetical protein
MTAVKARTSVFQCGRTMRRRRAVRDLNGDSKLEVSVSGTICSDRVTLSKN